MCVLHVVQCKGWGSASLVLCARVLSEIKALRNTSFTGLELEAPTALCCSTGCNSIIDGVQDLATTAMRGMDPNGVVSCSDGHATHLQHFVGLVPDANSGHAAELQYWLAVAGVRTHDGSRGVQTLPPHVRTSLATSLVRWSASLWQDNDVDASRCPRVWVGVLHHHHRDDRLLLRPVCEHTECLHAVRPFQRREVGRWTRIQASLSSMHSDGMTHHEAGIHVQVPTRVLMERSGRVLALVSSGDGRDDDAQTLDPEDVSDGVTKVMACVSEHAKVPGSIFSSVHADLRNPLQLVQVVANGSAPSDHGNSLSKLWLCPRHADRTELMQLRRREQVMAAAVSQLAQWYWHDGHVSHAYGHSCNTQLESALRCEEARVVLHVAAADGVYASDTKHTVRLRTSPMRVMESGATVVRISGESYAVCGGRCVVARWVCELTSCSRCCRHPFPSTWTISSNANFTFEELRSGDEFAQVERQLHESLAGATVISVTRYGSRATCVCSWCHVLIRWARLHSAHNRFQWQRYGQQRDLMLATAATEHRFDEKKVLRETLLWHGTSDTDPMVVCTSRDGVDARRVRKA